MSFREAPLQLHRCCEIEGGNHDGLRCRGEVVRTGASRSLGEPGRGSAPWDDKEMDGGLNENNSDLAGNTSQELMVKITEGSS